MAPPHESSHLIVIPSLDSPEYVDAVQRVHKAVVASGVATVMVKRKTYEVQRINTTTIPARPLYVAVNGRHEFMRRTIPELIAELGAVISSGSWSEFEGREDIAPADALGDITGAFFESPDDMQSRQNPQSDEITDPFVGAGLIRRTRRPSDSAAQSDL